MSSKPPRFRRLAPSLRRVALSVLCGLAFFVSPAGAVLIDSGDGRGNTSAPADDPGWKRMGTKAQCPPHCGLSYFYLGKGWVITAAHVNARDVLFENTRTRYPAIQNSRRYIGGRRSGVDLIMFRIGGAPDLPLYAISKSTPAPGTEVLMMGRGQSRGAELDGKPSRGWSPESPARLRWGTNRVEGSGLSRHTQVFSLRFDSARDPRATEHEAIATPGDSGGAVFVKQADGWELAGIMVTATDPVYGEGVTGVVDLSHYRDEILSIVAREP